MAFLLEVEGATDLFAVQVLRLIFNQQQIHGGSRVRLVR